MIFFYSIGTIVTFVLFMIDKSQAIMKRWRVPEWVLLFSTFLFGTFGALLGMILFRHKISKKSFLAKFFIVVAIQFAFIFIIYNN